MILKYPYVTIHAPSGLQPFNMGTYRAASTGAHEEPSRLEGDISHEIGAVLHALILVVVMLLTSLRVGAIITALTA